jgi:RNA polymerase sigma-70 factor (ECF subfamily)
MESDVRPDMSETEQVESENRWRTLMRATQAGDRDAYAELLEDLVPYIRRIVRYRRRFLRPEDVEDAVQDVLLSLHAVRTTYDARRPFMPWLLAIVRNRLADRARRDIRRARHEVPGSDPDVTFTPEPANTPYEEFGDAAALHRAVSELPAGQRRAIELLKIQELSLKEAAEATGTSVGALKVATHRAMAALRKALARS